MSSAESFTQLAKPETKPHWVVTVLTLLLVDMKESTYSHTAAQITIIQFSISWTTYHLTDKRIDETEGCSPKMRSSGRVMLVKE